MDVDKNALRAEMENMSAEDRINLQVETATGIYKTLTHNEEMKKLSVEEKWELLCKAQPEFTRCYPVICIAMLDERYHPDVFRRWLHRLEKNPGKGMDGYCERQADYSMMLFKKLNPGWNKKQAKGVWDSTYTMLKKEQKSVEKAEKTAREKQEIERKQFDKELYDEFFAFLIRNNEDDSK